MKLDKKKFIDSLVGRLIEGELEAFSEQGTEGTHWSLHRYNKEVKSEYENLFSLHPGDYLVVLDKKNNIVWEGTIDFYYQKDGWQVVEDYGTVHGLQKGVDPKVWAKMFFDALPAYLIKKTPQ